MEIKTLDGFDEISHRITLGKIIYTPSGVCLVTSFGYNKIWISWSEIDSLTFIPFLQRGRGEEWISFSKEKVEDIDSLSITVYLTKRHDVYGRANNLMMKIWLKSFLYFRSLRFFDGSISTNRGTFKFMVKFKTLSCPRQEFIEFLANQTTFKM